MLPAARHPSLYTKRFNMSVQAKPLSHLSPTNRYVLRIIFFFCALYIFMLALSFALFPDDPTSYVDTYEAPQSIYTTDPKYLLFSIDRLARSDTRVILLGSSIVRDGLRPHELSPLLGVSVDNLAIGTSDLAEQRQALEMAYEQIDPENWHKLTIVVGMFYGNFVESKQVHPSGTTNIDAEKVRYGLESSDRTGESQQFAFKQWMLRPLFLTSRWNLILAPKIRSLVSKVGRSLLGQFSVPDEPTRNDRNSHRLTVDEKNNALRLWNIYMGPIAQWKEDNFFALVKLAQLATSKKSKLVVLDLPLPQWHRDASPYFQLYESRKLRFIDEIKAMSGVTYSSLQNSLGDEDFYDSGHPRPKDTIKLARAAAKIIAPTLELTTEHMKLQDDPSKNRSTTATKQSPPKS